MTTNHTPTIGNIVKITLTRAESDVWNWAQSAAVDYWEDDYGRADGLHFDDCPVQAAHDGCAVILNHPDVIGDMIYRLGVQLQEMAQCEGGIWANGTPDEDAKKARNTAKIARRVVKMLESTQGK